MRVSLFHNPTAGKGQVKKKDLAAACKLAGLRTSYFSTKADTKKALRKRTNLIVVAGGDGTVSNIACQLVGRDVPLAIVPLGNANNIARSLGIAGTLHELAESWVQGNKQALDIGLAFGAWGSRKFVEAVGVGPFATIIKNNVASDKKHGAANLRQGRKELRKAFKKAEPRDYKLELDNRAVAGKFVAVEIANTAYSGPGLELASKSAPGDALLNVICVRAADRSRVMQWLDAPHKSRPPMRAKRGKKVSFSWHGGPLRIDDDVIAEGKDPQVVTVELAGAVDVIVPGKDANGRTGKNRKTNGGPRVNGANQERQDA
jgi:diacylglycerol kinase family enzyme